MYISAYYFRIHSNDVTKAGSYNLKVTAKYTGAAYTNIGELPFSVTLVDACIAAVLTI